ncbi:hypothetical protein A2714_04965 [Candidatus Woesebacteria bacterium RIFCSPHIGHO2_01_FULL_38_9]|uniref:Uncharacterized protein n=2 Tax=Candidatus Woeseibacteriota TaxID=1752722 RepID=A0A1F7XYF3_9BACT|nr:MAG: hypothetical protein A2714_04965 [Candidatus Woesebacteria bacterium RIFCSPHIGHO2_01_FULL_38_9]OGM59738.1 MAG: hypothetical protein A3A75_02185 [Candidatus Woesebacteria bacterium RIFCSPLOWO2_01_FULL_39_10]
MDPEKKEAYLRYISSEEVTQGLIDWRKEELERINKLTLTPTGIEQLKEELSELSRELDDFDLITPEGARESAQTFDGENMGWLFVVLKGALGEQ